MALLYIKNILRNIGNAIDTEAKKTKQKLFSHSTTLNSFWSSEYLETSFYSHRERFTSGTYYGLVRLAQHSEESDSHFI